MRSLSVTVFAAIGMFILGACSTLGDLTPEQQAYALCSSYTIAAESAVRFLDDPATPDAVSAAIRDATRVAWGSDSIPGPAQIACTGGVPSNPDPIFDLINQVQELL